MTGFQRQNKKLKILCKSSAEAYANPLLECEAAQEFLKYSGILSFLFSIVLIFVLVSLPQDVFAEADEVLTQKKVQPAEFVGSQNCVSCHQREHANWKSSDHHAAMQEVNERSVLGDFDGAKFTQDGVTSTFYKKNAQYFVRTDGPDGKLTDFQIRYTFGISPLQQYLIAFPGGRFQALGIAWDGRPKAEGGQRWFSLYPNQKLKAGDPLHWTGIDQNWNFQCAWCHSTNLQKNYDSTNQTFNTTWSEINVGCESCHGPASRHIAWAGSKDRQSQSNPDPNKGFALRFDERHGVTWPMGSNGQAHRSIPRNSSKEIEICAQCHSRRQQFSSQPSNLLSLFDAFRPATLDQGLYYADGQQRDEVYTYGSFLQSKMHAAGVTCSDCHNPHSGRINAEGNAVCSQCHAPEHFDTPKHHHHNVNGKGAKCVSCHMPTTTYMGIDQRHDHSIRIPRPDRSILLGVPNACISCHADQKSDWARDALKAWYPSPDLGAQDFAEAFDLSDRQAAGALPALLKVASSSQTPAIVKASLFRRLALSPTPQSVRVAKDALTDPDPFVRASAISVLRTLDPSTRSRLLSPLLKDTSGLVRMDAARALAGMSEGEISSEDKPYFEKALAEYQSAQLFNAERPEAQTTLATLAWEQGKIEDARAAFRMALALDPTFVAAAVSLSDLEHSAGNDPRAEEILRESLERNPNSGPVQHALGLSLIRQKKKEEALPFLAEATNNSPEVSRFGYVLAIALYDMGKPKDALEVLQNVVARHPYDRESLAAVVTYSMEMERYKEAEQALEQLVKLEPSRPEFSQLLKQLKKKDQ